jgi:hypothetical protein
LSERVAVAGKAFADECRIVHRPGNHAGCHHNVAYVAEKGEKVTRFQRQDEVPAACRLSHEFQRLRKSCAQWIFRREQELRGW